MRFLCLLFLVGCVSSDHLDHLLVYSHPDENSPQIQDPTTTITTGTTGTPVEAYTHPAVIVIDPQNQHINHHLHHLHDQPLTTYSSVETSGSPAEKYVIPAVTEPIATGIHGVLGIKVTTQEPAIVPSVTEAVTDSINDIVTETVTQFATVLTDTVTKTVTIVPGFSTLTITDFQTITAPATVLTNTVVEKAPRSTVTVTYIPELNTTPLVYTITQSSFITVTQTRPIVVAQTQPHPTLLPVNVLKDNYVTRTKTPLFFGKSADPTPNSSENNEGEFLIIKPAGPIVSLSEVPSTVETANDGVAKSLDNDADEDLVVPIVPIDEVSPAINVVNENVGKSLDNDADDVVAEVTTNTPAAPTTIRSTVPADISSTTAIPTRAPVGRPKSISFIDSEEVITDNESIENDSIEILRGNLIYAIYKNDTDVFRRN